ncbi:hypothetical protein [Gluconacetobacter takamatsuzukensis]|uniref:DNA transfer protein n=1 Tax=Gluconacetobacter takamatsuzukensis TaxID=1286190 RepID=A0A7W4PRM4_9PROT|nr:hypothetical protein [Gluconacetobacter takamatsuzukensis]MBB2205629.1 hypothetical protein [Gluconacetobacter takamatsuzukensis]
MVTAIGSGLSALGSIASGVMGSDAASRAAQEQAQAYAKAQQFQQTVYGQTAQDLSPYMGTGTNALYSLASLLGLPGGTSGQGSGAAAAYQAFTDTPYYQFPLQQGEQSLDSSAAARGLALSGGQVNALQNYAENYAGQQFGTYMNALSSLAGMGSSAATALGSQGNGAAATMLSALSGQGNAQAQGTTASNAALMSGIGNALAQLVGSNNSPGMLGNLYGANNGGSY